MTREEAREGEENRKSYSIACFTSEDYIFVGTVESYILNGKSVDKDRYEDLEILEYSKENRFVRFSCSEENPGFSLCKEEDVDKKNLISLDRPEGEHEWDSGHLFFEVKPETCILSAEDGEFEVFIGRENVLYEMNRIM
jgi:hypothetical protein